MKLDKTLNFKKVRRVKAYGDCLTFGKEYSVLDIRMEVKVKDDEGDNCYWESDHFEPVVDDELPKSAENPLQNMKLTPELETEASEPKFKVGDKVYFGTDPNIKTISEVGRDNDLELDGEFGWVSGDCCCHATQENHEMLCKLYPNIKFEAPPKELKGSDLARAMLERGDRRIYGYASDNSDNDPHGYECVVRDYDVNSGFGVIMSNARYEFFNPCDPRTGEPLTQAVLDE